MKLERFEVTAEDIAMGVKEDGYLCPIALALRLLGFTPTVDLGVTELAPYRDRYGHGAGVDRWLEDFDSGLPVKPITINVVDHEEGRYFELA